MKVARTQKDLGPQCTGIRVPSRRSCSTAVDNILGLDGDVVTGWNPSQAAAENATGAGSTSCTPY